MPELKHPRTGGDAGMNRALTRPYALGGLFVAVIGTLISLGLFFLERNASLSPWLILPVGFVLTLVLAFYLRSVLLQRQHAEDLVRGRTAALADSEQRYRSLFEQSREGLMIFDPDGRVRDANQAALDMTAYSREEVRTLTYRDFIPERWQAIQAELTQKQAVQYSFSDFTERTCMRRDGSSFIADIRVWLIRDASGNPAGITAWFQDITERRQSQIRRLLLASIVDSSDDAIVGMTTDGIITSWNKGAEQIYGYTEGETVGKSITIVVPLELREGVAQILAKIRQGQTIAHHETVRQHKDGTYIPVSLTVSPIRDVDGGIIGASAIGRDITERKRAEEAIRQSEERYRSLFHNNHAVMLLIDPETADIVDANPAACRYYGYSLFELKALKVSDINTLSRAEIFEEMSRAKAEQRNQFYFSHRLASGEVRPVEVFSGPIEIEGRKVLYSIVHDISERRLAEESVRRNEQRLQRILEDMPLATAYTDNQGNVEFANRTFYDLFGYTMAEIPTIEQWFLRAYPDPDHRNAVMASWNADATRAKAHGTRIGPTEYTVTAKNGTVYTCEVTGTFLEKGVLALFHDITERKQAEEALRQSEERMRVQFKSIPVPTFVWKQQDGNLVLADFNDAALYFTKGMITQHIGVAADDFYRDMPHIGSDIRRCINERAAIEHDFWYELKPMTERKYVVVKYAFVPPDLVLMLVNDITLQKLAEEHLQYISIHDSLTGLYNRFYADVEIDRVTASRKYPVSIIMIDLDGLKTVNDREGHAAGDHLLRDAAAILRQSFRPEDMIARIGGDEFLVILPAVDETVCGQSAARLKTNLEIFNARGPGRMVRFSVGTATAYSGGDLRECIQQADERMYREKAEKKLNPSPPS